MLQPTPSPFTSSLCRLFILDDIIILLKNTLLSGMSHYDGRFSGEGGRVHIRSERGDWGSANHDGP